MQYCYKVILTLLAIYLSLYTLAYGHPVSSGDVVHHTTPSGSAEVQHSHYTPGKIDPDDTFCKIQADLYAQYQMLSEKINEKEWDDKLHDNSTVQDRRAAALMVCDMFWKFLLFFVSPYGAAMYWYYTCLGGTVFAVVVYVVRCDFRMVRRIVLCVLTVMCCVCMCGLRVQAVVTEAKHANEDRTWFHVGNECDEECQENQARASRIFQHYTIGKGVYDYSQRSYESDLEAKASILKSAKATVEDEINVLAQKEGEKRKDMRAKEKKEKLARLEKWMYGASVLCDANSQMKYRDHSQAGTFLISD